MTDVSKMVAQYRQENNIPASMSDAEVAQKMLAERNNMEIQMASEQLTALIQTQEKDPIGDVASFKSRDVLTHEEPPKPSWFDSLPTLGKIGVAVGGLGAFAGLCVACPPAGVALGVIGLALGATSCEKTDVYAPTTEIPVDIGGGIDAIVEAIKNEAAKGREQDKAYFEAILAKLDQMDSNQKNLLKNIIASINEFSASNAEITELLKKIGTAVTDGNKANLDMLKNIYETLTSLKSEQSDFNDQALVLLNEIFAKQTEASGDAKTFYNQILELIEKGAKTDKESQEALLSILQQIETSIKDGTTVNKDGFQAVLDMLSQIQNDQLTGDADMITVLTNMWADMNAGNEDIVAVLKEMNANQLASNAGLRKLITDLYNDGQVNAAERHNQIMEAIESFKGIKDAIEGLGKEITNKGDDICVEIKNLQDILKNFNGGNTDLTGLMAELQAIIAQLAKNNELTNETNELLKGLGDKIDNLGAGSSVKDYTDVLNEILAAIKDGDAAIVDELGKLADKQDQMIANFGDYADQTHNDFEALKNALKGITGSGTAVDLTTTNNLIQTVITLLNNKNNAKVDLTPVVDLITNTNAALAAIQDQISKIKVSGGAATDLTTTNNLIQTCISQLQVLVKSQAASSEVLGQVTALGTQLTSVIEQLGKGNSDTADINKKLDAIYQEIQKMTA